MRVVVDSQTLFDGVFDTDQYARTLLSWAAKGTITICVSVPCSDEYVQTLERIIATSGMLPTQASWLRTKLARALLASMAVNVPKGHKARYVPDDEEDDKFVAAAVFGNAPYIISRDGHLGAISGQYTTKAGQTISVCSAYQFVQANRKAIR